MSKRAAVTVHVDAPPKRVWALVSDLPRMGEWSPETTAVQWVGDVSGPTVGARFRGSNKIGVRRWRTTGTIVESIPNESLAFEITSGRLKVARWSYRIVPAPAGCDVTETWEDQRGRLISVLGGVATGVADRQTHNLAGMRTTLERLKATAEATA